MIAAADPLLPMRPVPAGTDLTVSIREDEALLVIRITGPSLAGCPQLSWAGGRGADSEAWRQLRLCVELIGAAQKLGDPRALHALAAYPRIARILAHVSAALEGGLGTVHDLESARRRRLS